MIQFGKYIDMFELGWNQHYYSEVGSHKLLKQDSFWALIFLLGKCKLLEITAMISFKWQLMK